MLGIVKNSHGTRLEIKNAFANIAANTTDGVLVAAVPDYSIVGLAIFGHLAGSVETLVTLNSKGANAGTAISSTKQVAANGGFVMARGCETDFLFRTLPGQALTVNTGSGSTVGFDLVYVLVKN